jgi:hypothetical protein
MKLTITGILVIAIIFSACSQNQQKENGLSILPSIKDSFLNAVQFVDTADRDDVIGDNMTAILIPRAMGDIEEELFSANNTEGFVMPCQCAMVKDTLVILTGIAYEGGFAYVSEIINGQVENKLKLFGKKPRWRTDGGEWLNQIEVASKTNRLVLSTKFPPAMDDVLHGMFEIETIPFWEQDGKLSKEQKHKLKIYFTCKVFPSIL